LFVFHRLGYPEDDMVRLVRFNTRLLLLFWFLIPAALFSAETGKISGRVTEKGKHDPLIGANVFVDAMWVEGKEVKMTVPVGASSDLNGQYYILNLRPGAYSLHCQLIGFGRAEVTKVKVFIDRTTEVNFALDVQVLEGQEVVITSFRPNELEKDLTATKQTYDIVDVQGLAGVNSVSDIIALQADVVDNHFRGGREGESNYLIAGGSINNPLDASKAFSPMVNALQTVEVLTSGFSAEYGNAQSGVINMIPKEGGDTWTARADISMDLPHYQMWGGNPFSTSNMPFYTLLSNPQEWKTGYLEYGASTERTLAGSKDWSIVPKDTNSVNYKNLPSQLKALYLSLDSLRAAKMAMISWLQAARDVTREDTGIPQHKVNLIIGGPLTTDVRLFIAAEQEKKNLEIPTVQPDLTRQVMGNITLQGSQRDKFTLSYNYSSAFTNGLGGITDWFDRIIQNPITVKSSQLVGLRWMHQLNQMSFTDIALRMFDTKSLTRVEFLEPGRYTDVNAFNGGKESGLYYIDQSNLAVPFDVNGAGVGSRGVGPENTRTYSLTGSYTAQVTPNNMIKTGVQGQYYTLSNDRVFGMNNRSDYSYAKWTVHPYEGALYVQDKMEFQGFIANIGLRYDFYDFNYNYYTNIFNPLKNPVDTLSGALPDPTKAPTDMTKLFGTLQPRLGISFPVTEMSVFHLNYGTFIQRPAFNYVIGGQYHLANGNLSVVKIGNAQLKPEKTSAWDVGIVQALPQGFRIDVSAYYKDVNNLVEQADYVNLSDGLTYTNYANKDYANIKGFNINIEKSRDVFNFNLRYNYQIAKGKASGPSGAPITIYRTLQGTDSVQGSLAVGTRDILLDYDRTHRLLASVKLITSNGAWPEIFSVRPFANLSVSATFTFQTGRPYSDFYSGDQTTNNMRMPDVYDLKMRVQKSFKAGAYKYTAYVEGFNILNFKEWSYGIFSDKLNKLRRWNDGERDGLVFYSPKYDQTPTKLEEMFVYSNAASIYSNQPRYFRLGLWIEL
jgi:outer membrane receptor protein involved in Fe transport